MTPKSLDKGIQEEGIEKFDEETIQKIAQKTFEVIKEELKKEDFSKQIVEDLMKVDLVEPQNEVITQKEFSKSIEIAGWLIFAGCVGYFIYFFFIVQYYEPLTFTTYITLNFIAFTAIRRFTSYLFNSITCLSVYGFIVISITYIPLVDSIEILIVGPILHGAMAGFQLFLIIHKKIPMSKRYLLWGFLFYLIFLSSFDQFSRLNRLTGLDPEQYPDVFIAVVSFLGLSSAIFFIYVYKKRFGVLIP
ncbi:MAG: membrane protein of unknown function [Promethearchaeota archaeon]|nr:MAG: membrane protein of unknown function [Candidatus Lokiarchaeota archaeon]